MNRSMLLTLILGSASLAPSVAAQEPTHRAQAFQDHIAYVATFAMPIVIEQCANDDPEYLKQAAPAYFRFVNARQDAIERGRLLTLAELRPEDTLQDYRKRTIASRLGLLDSGTPDQKRQVCAGALAMLTGALVPQGEWPAGD